MHRRLLLAGSVAGVTALPFRPGLAAGTAARDLVWDVLAGGDAARPYRIFLRVPAAPPPAEGYPVFYMLDGEAQFGLVEAALRDDGARDEAAAGGTQARGAQAGDAQAGHAPAGNVPAGEVPAGSARAGDARAGDTQAGDTQTGNTRTGSTRTGSTRAENGPDEASATPPGGEVPRDGVEPVVPGLVVAIGYAGESRREYDYTPPSEGGPAEEGGAEGFLDFIERELKPRVEAAFPVDRRRQALYGHSYGGLFALYALFTRPGSFHRTVAASPSIWYGNGAVLRAEERFAASPPPDAGALELLVTVGELEGGRPGSAGGDSDLARVAQQVERARALSDRLGVLGERGPRMRFHIFPGQNHGSVIPVALRRGLRFAFRPG
ncbi:alpha/beta hydrolase [Roseomonas elaeocarpi]|uniref:Alpha/beta hydrolase n=1 Tax=Roseomonas elaeocarpi TaxID=907779 RepID=A0ABV6JSS4_9PROT